jgi:uroporphyrinogen III methyltransferase / synthase
MPQVPPSGPAQPPPPPKLPLLGRRIVVTRAREQAADLTQALTALGAEVVAAPVIRIDPLADLEPLRAALADLSRYEWIVFTSQNTVQVVCDRLPEWGIPPTDLGRVAVAAIGPATATALARHGVTPDLVPEEFVAEAVVRAIAVRGDLRGKRILLPRALEARDALPGGLSALGAMVDAIPVYRTVRETGDGHALAAEILAGKIDAITFTSSSTVRHFVEIVGGEAATSGRFAAAVIGPVTAATARASGVAVAIEAEEYTAPGLVAALVRYFSRAPGHAERET